MKTRFGPRTRVAIVALLLAASTAITVQSSQAAGPPYPLLRWTAMPTHAAQFSERDAYAYNPDTGDIVVFGHTEYAGNAGAATYVFDGEDWLQQNPKHSPSPRIGAAMGYDPILKQIVLFGGVPNENSGANAILGDMWAWDGTDWSQVTSVTSSPPPRAFGTMVATQLGTLLFGGVAKATCVPSLFCGNALNDTWLFTGVAWTQMSPSSLPPARYGAVLADSPDTSTTIMFGGVNNIGSFHDTWSWDGSNWTRLTSGGAPFPASGAGYDPASKLMTAQAYANDTTYTALWNGKNWTYQRLSPQPDFARGFVYDSKRGYDVSFGTPAIGGVIRSVHILNQARLSLGGQLLGGPDAASWQAGRSDVFVHGTDHQLWHKWFTNGGWSDWESLGGILTSDPGVVAWGPGRLDVFVRGTDNALWHKWWDGGWHGWESLGGILTSGPDAASTGPGKLEVFARGTDDALWHRGWENGRGWSNWQTLGGTLTSDPGAAGLHDGSSKMFVVVRGTDNAMYSRTEVGGNWTDWQRLGGLWDSSPDVAQFSGGVYAIRGDGIGHTTLENSGGWTAQAGPVTDSPSAAGETPDMVRVFARGTDGALWTSTDSQ